MLPGPLFSVFQQYKADTDPVAAWLASTAKKCGYPTDLLTGGAKAAPPKGAGRLKGKARKEAKIQKASQRAPPTSGPKYTIPIKEFIPLANHILASTKPLIKVPASFAETIDRVIYMRSTFGSKMVDHGLERDSIKDASHNYFVGVLESVRSILRPRMPTGTPELVSFEELSNRFSGLNIYEPSQEFLDAPDIVRPEKEQDDDNDYEAELQKSFSDAIMAYYVLIKDLNDIRSRIEWIWGNYQKGAFDPGNAAVATNTAIDLARSVIEQVLPIFEEHGGAIKIAEKYSLMCVDQQGIPPDEALKWGPGTGNERMYEEADKTFLNASVLLRTFTSDFDPSAIGVYTKEALHSMFGTYDPTSDRSKKDGHEKFKEDQIILGEFFLETITLTRLMPTFPVQDEFIRGIREWNQTGKLPFYLVFAAQCLLDIHHVLREDASLAFATLMEQMAFMREDINLHLEFLADVKMPNWPSQNTHALKEIEKSIVSLHADVFYHAKQAVLKLEGRAPVNVPKHRLLKLSPIMSGLVLYLYRARMYEIGIGVMNCWDSVTYSAHLYNALTKEGLYRGAWRDMDVLQHFLGRSNFFVGDPPDDRLGYYKRVLLQMGYSASAISSEGRLKSFKKSRSGARQIKSGAPVSSMFVKDAKLVAGNFSPEDVDEIIARSNYQQKGDVGLMMGKVNGQGRENQRKRAAEGGKLTPGELLKPLIMALTGDSMEFGFPYLWFTRLSWGLMRQVKKDCDPILRRLHGPTYLDDESQIPNIASMILQEFCHNPEGDGRQLMILAAGAFEYILLEKDLSDEAVQRFSEIHGLAIKSDTDLINESHDRWHERDDMIPADDCNWMDCGWYPDWEEGKDEEDEDNES